jgi:adenosylcobinamide amidohydrolase
MIAGVSVEVGSEAVVVTSGEPLRVLSSAVHHGGFVEARAIVNLHVHKNDPCADPSGMIGAFARRVGVPAPWVGL